MPRALIASFRRGPGSEGDDTSVMLLARTLAARGWDVDAYEGGMPPREALDAARASGEPSVLLVRGLPRLDAADLARFDAVIASSRVVGDALREVTGREATILPELVDPGRVVVGRREPKYLLFVDPSAENGVHAFARIADELGRQRPDIPILVVEGRGTEATVAACGLDLRRHGNVFFMPPTPDPGRYWRLARACLAPSLGIEARGEAAIEALVLGIPVVASDRGALPEVVGEAGGVLPLPDRITPATEWPPTAEEVRPWVECVIRLWDDREWYEERSRAALAEGRRWAPEAVESRYAAFFAGLEVRPESGPSPPVTPRPVPPGRRATRVLVPHLSGVEWECEQALRKLEEAGVAVVRSRGSSQIDVARNNLASEALHDGFESIFFIDADLGFDPADALRLVARPEPVVSGVYAKKGRREMASRFADGVGEIRFGAEAPGPYPLKYAATGFLRIRAPVLRRMVDVLGLPLCNTKWGRGAWPFFQPIWVPDGDGGFHYLGEDWAFSHRLSQVGVTPLAISSIRLWHYGQYPYGWEDAGEDRARFPSYRYRTTGP